MSYQILYDRNPGGQYNEEEERPDTDSDSYEESTLRRSARATRGSHRRPAGDEESNIASGEMEELCW